MAPSDNASSATEDFSTTEPSAFYAPGDHHTIVTTSRSKGVTAESAWVRRTYCMVNDGSQSQPNVLSWGDGGTAFEIRDVEALKKDLFPKYHGETKFESFTRRLRRYGFHRERNEPITKIAEGQRTITLTFSHPNFQRDHPELLTGLAILQQDGDNKTKTSSEENQTLINTLVDLEKTQSDLNETIKRMRDQGFEQRMSLQRLQQETESKDETIRNLESRMERLENSLFTALGPLHRRSTTSWPTNNSQLHPARLPPSQPLVQWPSSNLEREISAVGQLEWQDGNFLDEEPTLPRSKKMKLYHKGMSAKEIFDGLPLSRETTPLFVTLPCP